MLEVLPLRVGVISGVWRLRCCLSSDMESPRWESNPQSRFCRPMPCRLATGTEFTFDLLESGAPGNTEKAPDSRGLGIVGRLSSLDLRSSWSSSSARSKPSSRGHSSRACSIAVRGASVSPRPRKQLSAYRTSRRSSADKDENHWSTWVTSGSPQARGPRAKRRSRRRKTGDRPHASARRRR